MLKRLLSLTILMFWGYLIQAQVISGTVYRDYNGNGIRETSGTYSEPGAAGVIVNAYDATNALVTTTTSAGDGTFSMPFTVAVRVEFEIPSSSGCVSQNLDFTGFSGEGNSVRFVTAATSNLNYAVLAPEDYVANNNPKVFVPIYKNGNPTGSGTGTPQQSFFTGYDWSSNGSAANQINLAASQIGAVYGVAYSKQAKRIFTAAFIKRHVGLGPLGSGGIYMLEPTGSSFNVTNFYDMDANGYRTRAAASAPAYGNSSSFSIASNTTITFLGANDSESGFPEGLGVVGSNSDRGLPVGLSTDNYDPAAFGQVGKVGLGDIDISDDGKFLFVMNLYSRKVYRLELNDAYNPTSIVSVTSYALPSVTANLGEFRCFGLGYHRGKLYVGGVTTGENGGSNIVGGTTDLYAYVYTLNDPKGSASFSASPEITYPLNYLRGYIITTLNTAPNKKWFPWTNVSSSPISDGFGESIYPMPMLTDIDFTDDGAMVMDFCDRAGHVWGYRNFRDLSSVATQTLVDVGGDILIAGKDCATGAFTLENNGSYTASGTTYTSAGAGNTEGPGGGEFYFDERPTDDYHHEASMGSLAFLRGSGKAIFTLMDANSAFAGGTTHFSSTTGAASNRLNLYGQTAGSFEKANGLGDIEMSGDEPGIEIGNRVWIDLNNDGIQGPGEIGLNDVEIVLYADFNNDQIPDGAALATITTSLDGNYYFNPGNVTDGDPNLPGSQPGPQPNKTYLICVGGSDWTSGAGTNELVGLSLATANVGGSGQPDVRDNDATLQGGIPCISVTTSKLGQNNHSADFGFVECTADAGPGITLTCSSPSGTIGTPAVPGNTYLWTPNTGLSADNIAQPTASPTTTITYTLTVNGLCTDQVTVTVDNTPPTADAGTDLTLNCTSSSGIIGTSAIAGNTYSWSPSSGLSASNIAEPTANPSATTSYTVTVTGSNGCTATDVVTVTVDNTPPTADAGMDLNLNCTITSGIIGTSAIAGNTYSWSPSSGLSASNVAEPTANPSATTSYTVTVTGSNGCTSTDVVTVTVDNTPPTADAGTDLNLNCTITSGVIGTSAMAGNTYSWVPSSGLSADNIAQPTANPSATTTYTVTVTGSNNCTATDVVTVTVDNTLPTADAGTDLNLNCTTTSGVIGTSAIAGNTYLWIPNTNLSADNIAQPTANPTTTTTYTVTVTGSNGCTATDVVTVNVDTTPPVADAGSNMTVDCNNASVTIGTAAIGGYTYLWSPNTNLSADNIAQPVANPGSSISYTVTVTGANGCTASDVVDVNVDLLPPTPGISGNTTVCNNGTTLLTASGGVAYSWNPSGANTASILGTTGTYTVTVTGSNGCTATSSVSINSVEGSIGNYVWYDANGNGIFDENPTSGINGMTVELWKETAPSSGIYSLDQTTTTANNLSSEPGYYQFIVCESANYKVKFPLSSGGQPLTTQTATSGTDNNSDPDRTTGESPVVAIDVNGGGVAKDNNTIDAGYYKPAQLGNYVWHDLDKDGTQDGNEVGVSGVTVTLYNSTNNAIVGATVTDAYGYYKFNPLAPGTYYVGFTVPANYIFTGQDQTADDSDSDPNATSGLTGNYTIVAGDSNMTVDAGIYVPGTSLACLGDKVWMDTDQDGVQDANEVGVAGVTVTLNNAAGDPIATTITNANGLYSFCDLQPGTYSVTFSKPIGYVLTGLDQGGDDTQDSDADPLTGQTATVTLVGGDNNLTLDAGLYPQTPTNAGLGNYVWNDVNNSGVQDDIETGVAGVTVTLYASDGTTVIGTTVTDELGYYIFNNLTPATYVVGFSNLPAGFNFSNPDQGGNDATDSDPDSGTGKTAPVTLTSGEFNLSLDAGIHNPTLPTAALGNYVWFDWNKNGVQDITENGVSGVTVTLYASDGTTILDNTVTNLFGFYFFDNLAAGSYVVGFSNIPNGFSFTTTDQGGNDAIDSDPDLITFKTPVTGLANGEINLTLDAGIIENSGKNNLGSLGDRVWFDDNQNGIQDVGENGVSGVTVTLYQADGTTVIQTKETDVLGNYIFTGLGAGSYVVGFSNIPGGYTFTTANQGSDDELDADADATSSGKTPVVNLALGEENLTLDAGIFAAPGLASLGNYVWIDVDQDGVQDANEPGVAGVTVTLFDNAGNQLQTTTTDPNGLYQFTGLTPDTYGVGFSNLPSGYELTTADQGGNDTQDSDADVATGLTPSVTLIAGQNYPDFDAGIFTNLASLGNYVWSDLDQDGIQDPLEEGIPGITVTLYAANGITPISTAVTNAAGFYNFVNLIPGTYVVGFSNIPNGAQFSPANQGSDDALDSDAEITDGKTTPVTLSAGEYNPTLDAGIFTPLGAGLGDFVWFDLNNDGQQDANEPGVPGVTAILNDAGGSPIKSTITDANGYYTFPNLPPGTYSVTFTTLPYNRLFTSQNSGSDAGDNDVVNIVNLPSGYPQSGTTPTYTLAAGEYNPTIDAGMFTGIPLSVDAIHATATLQGQNSRVQWVTTDEKNVDHFEIERSTTGSQFVKIATHAALGNTQGEHSYQISDDVADLISEPVIYYRVKVLDIDGRFVYSNITSVRPAVSGQMNAYPSPFTASFTIGYTSENDGEVDIVLTDMAGRKVLSQTRQVKEGFNQFTLTGLQGLAAGQYSVRIKDFNTDAEFVLKVEKQ